MDPSSSNGSPKEINKLTLDIINSFSCEGNGNWSLLNIYLNEYLAGKELDKALITSYSAVLSALLDALKPTLFKEKWQETLFDEIFLKGILHESFLVLVKRLSHSEKYAKHKVIYLLEKFIQRPILENLFVNQCVSSKNWDLKIVSKLGIWDHLITAIVSLPDRIANETKGKIAKVMNPSYYEALLLSTVFKVLNTVCESLKNSQDCSLEFLAKLTGKICLLGKADIAACMYLKEFLKQSESEYIWRRISQNFISKMPSSSLDSFILNLLLKIPWYGYIEWILGDEGMKNEKVNYIMTFKLLFIQTFKCDIILQNIIGYFASSTHRVSGFVKILNSLLDCWRDERSLRHQDTDQKMYISLALMVCAGWLKQLPQNLILNKNDYINKVSEGIQIRLKSSEEAVHAMGMIVGGNLIKSLDPDCPALEYECRDVDLQNQLKAMLEIPPKPDNNVISFEDFKLFEEPGDSNENREAEENDKEEECINSKLDSDDEDLEPYDMSNDVPQSGTKRPLYLRDCMAGLIQQENAEWTEQCLKHAVELIEANPYATAEVAEEMAKIMLHLNDNFAITNFIELRHKILITLTVQCPVVVVNYLVSQFTERDYVTLQRIDILEVLAASSVLLAYPKSSEACSVSTPKICAKREPDWQIIINQRLEAKTKRYTKMQKLTHKENKFSPIAANFFYPLLNSYEKACKILKLHSDDSYVLGRFIHTLGLIMYSASNTLPCGEMGLELLKFLYSLRNHKDVFVRRSIIFAVAATYMAVPSSILVTQMLPEVINMTEWLQDVGRTDFDHDCMEKAHYALSISQEAVAEGLMLHQLKELSTTD